MSIANRTITLPGIWADDATTTIPGTPVTGTSYRNGSLSSDIVTAGWPFGQIVASEDHNQYNYIASSLLQQLEQQGILSWCVTVAYPVGAIALGSDGNAYRCILASTGNDPTSSPTFWALWGTVAFASDAETIAGALTTKAVVPHGLAAAFAGTKTASGYQKLEGGLILQWVVGTGQSGGNGSSSETPQTVTWPIAFPTACLIAFPAVKIAAASWQFDAWYQLISFTNTTVTVQRQLSTSSSSGTSTPLILGLGY